MNKPSRLTRSLLPLLGLLGLLSLSAHAGVTDIASAPLFTSSTTVVKPNLLFTLDDSGSMAWDFMPDDAVFGTGGFSSKYGRRSSQCNGLAYNPSAAKQPYALPVDSTGTELGNASMAFLSGTQYAAGTVSNLSTGYVSNTASQRSTTSPASLSVVSSGSISVTTSGGSASTYFVGMVVSVFGSSVVGGSTVYDDSRYMIGKVTAWDSTSKVLTIDVAMSVGSGSITGIYVGNGSPIDNVYYVYSGTQTAMSYRYPGNVLDTASTFYSECNSSLTGTVGRGVFSAVIVTPSSTEAQRYANWYHYYSTRMRMMKTSLTLAFKNIDDKYRVGFMSINSNTGGILDVADFGATQKASFYSRVNGADPRNSTPLRAALSKAGSYYAKKLSGQTYDPVQYSCQKNFTILSTDGYWNGSAGYQLDGTAIGQQDGGTTERPMYDGGVDTVTSTETWSTTSVVDRTTVYKLKSTTTKTKVDTTYTPYKSQYRYTYSLTTSTYTTFNNSSVAYVGSCTLAAGKYTCTVEITTPSAHGYTVGQSVTVAGVTPTTYNGTQTVTAVPSTTKYRFVMTGLTSVPAVPTSTKYGTSADATSGCASGKGKQMQQTQLRDLRHSTTSTVVTTEVTPGPRTLVERITTVTPYTRNFVTINGVTSTDTTTAGTPTVTTTTVSDNTVPGTMVSTTAAPVAGTGADDTTAWVDSGAPVQLASCVSSASSTTSAATYTPTGTATTTTTSNSTAGPTAGTDGNDITTTTPVVTSTARTSSSSTSTAAATSDTLADVAMYYYQTDLRTSGLRNCTGAIGKDVCENNVTALGRDKATWQHMSTFTLSLGMSGTLTYDPNYESQTSGDYYDIVSGNKNWTSPASDGGAVNIDDLWHAAVNGRGRFFSASDPATLAASLAAALNSIKAVIGSSSAAATSTLQPVEGDNGVYIAQFKSAEWSGDLRAYKIDTNNGSVSTSRLDESGNLVDTSDWSAAARLSPTTERKIYYAKAGALHEFTYTNLTADGMNGYFDNACSKTPALTQCSTLTGGSRTTVNSGSEMVSFLRGQPQPLYRGRTQILGDIVNSSPVYVGKPSFRYTESSYSSFKTTNATRVPTLYVGANDGMLHAFDAATGDERWAYVPTMVMANMYKLGDSFYESKHQYFVDATPVAGDIYVGGAWKTILVGGLNAGGSGYYALDITDPLNPKALWEFTNSKLGLTYGNPVITKRRDGTWIVAVTSGYNNADGLGHLFILDANTGALLKTVSTTEGSSGSPSGLGKLNAWVDYDTENLARRFYAGDMFGNLWRFDIDDVLEPKSAALKLAQLIKDGVQQPITTVPQLAEIESEGSKYPVIYVGTGRYLGTTDVTNTDTQSIYAIKDLLSDTGLADVRTGGTLVQQTLTTSGSTRSVSDAHPVDWASKNGWYLDLGTPGERINVDMQLAFNVLTAAGNMPGSTATDCTSASSGSSWLYQLNVATGKATGEKLSSMVAGLSTVQLAKGTGLTIVTKTDVSDPLPKAIEPSSSTSKRPRRSSWRELVD